MKNLDIIDKETGMIISYPLSKIDYFKIAKAKEYYTVDDCERNGINPEETILRIYFKDNNVTHFTTGEDWICSIR